MRNRSRGFSLVELMVGIALSLIVLLSMMSFYASAVRNTAEANVGAKFDGDVLLSFLQIDRIAQNIGFGMTGAAAYGTRIQVYSSAGAAVGQGVAGNSVVWQTSPTTCQALVGGTSGVSFFGSGAGYACASGLVAPPSGNVAEVLLPSPSQTVSNPNAMGTVTFAVESATNCMPFGVTSLIVGGTSPAVQGGAFRLVVTINTYSGAVGTSTNAVANRTCLFNLR